MTGIAPFVPGLLGLPRDYLNAQLGAWRNGKRRRARRPTAWRRSRSSSRREEIGAVSAWLAAQPVPAGAKPAAAMPRRRCRSPAAASPPASAAGTRAMRLRRGLGIAGSRRSARSSRSRGVVAWLNLRGEDTARRRRRRASPPRAELVARGEYLARAGNCIGCHTARGGAPYAGGRGIETPFGTVYASEPHARPGRPASARWSADEFWRALHNGRSRDGRLLYPAFPYPNYTRVVARRRRRDVRLPAEPAAGGAAEPRSTRLRFPFDPQAALAVWRALYFRPGAFDVDDPARSAEWNRGAYLVEGLGHCNACHSRAQRARRDRAARSTSPAA